MGKAGILALFAISCATGAAGSDGPSEVDDLTARHDLSKAHDLAIEPPDEAVAPDDLAMGPVDLAPRPPDLKMPMVTTPHDVDTNVVANGTFARLTGLVLTGIARSEGVANGTSCRYGAFAQDPMGTAPSGMRLFSFGAKCTPTDAGDCTCPLPPTSGTPLDAAGTLGQVFDVDGTVDVFSMAGSPTIHEIVVKTLTANGTGTITPTVLTDGGPFITNGAGYAAYESMLVTIKPPQAFPVFNFTSFGDFDGANGHWVGIYRFVYAKTGPDGGFFPPAGSHWSAITGIAQPSFGGGIAPRLMSDFVP